MNTTPKRFDNAMSALVSAFLKGTLAKGFCTHCAVGNMVARSMGYTLPELTGFVWSDREGTEKSVHWDEVFCTRSFLQTVNEDYYTGEAKAQIDSTGYSWQELARIEKAFEGSTKIRGSAYHSRTPDEIDADQLAGLMAVVDVLCQIEGITDPAPYKAQFDRTTEGSRSPSLTSS